MTWTIEYSFNFKFLKNSTNSIMNMIEIFFMIQYCIGIKEVKTVNLLIIFMLIALGLR